MRGALLGILLLGLVPGTGCGYKLGVLRHEGVSSVAVPIFEYRALEHRRGIERELSRAVAEEFISRSGLELTTTDEADAVLHGRITDYRERVIVRDERNDVLESSVVVTMNLLYERKDGKTLYKREKMREQAVFSLVSGESEADARRRAFNDLAQRIVFAMEGAW